MKTKDELVQERSWLQKNKKHPEYESRLEVFNQEVESYNNSIRAKNKALKSAFKIGDIVTVDHKKYGGIYRVEKFMIRNILLSRMDGKGNKIRCCPSLMKKVEGEKRDLVDELDSIGAL